MRDLVWVAVPFAVFLLAGAVAVGVGRQSLRWRRLVRHGVTAQGRCLGRPGKVDLNSQQQRVNRFEFTDLNGVRHRFDQNAPATWRAGRVVTVHYAPEDPGKAAVVTDLKGARVGNAVIAGAFGCLSLFALVFGGVVVLVLTGTLA